jgi:hypothetical protein
MTLDPVPNLGGGVQYLNLSAGTSHSYLAGAIEEVTDPREYDQAAHLLEAVLPTLEKRRKEAAVLAAKKQGEAEKERRKAETLREYAPLRREYGVDEHKYLSHPDELHSILETLKADEPLTPDQEEWLGKHQLERLLHLSWERQAERYEAESAVAAAPDVAANAAANASSLWRRVGKPDRALAATASLAPLPPTLGGRVSAKVLTTRGGAYRDVGDLANAERCGLDAVSLDPSNQYPYSLLGAVYYQMGEPTKGDAYFADAARLGAGDNRSALRRAVESAQGEARRRAAAHLLEKDRKAYAWAARYMTAE